MSASTAAALALALASTVLTNLAYLREHEASILQRRGVPVLLKVVKQESLEIILMAISSVAGAIIADKV